ncbi:unnamed protein product [Arabidopsis lyrata]|uniref:DUF3444 domain-containing protein n=2 Tax=Arabidopsis lyrata subsp. lyrata TaxID=81972 RepID=D7LYG4_ARALL|nr:hypothetical protein ARALYDRAFT_909888 [Arabidopsis lyrata subsp. lyrata]CAH8271538.1 unnamed protein product [Arabidopsis lyrata]
MDTTSNELPRRKADSETLMKGTSSDGDIPFSSACAVIVGEKRKMNEYGGSSNTGNRGVVHTNRRGSNDDGDTERGEESVQIQPKISEFVGPKFNDFGNLREEVNFAVGQTWALYDTTDGMPRLYAQIRKVSAPSFGLRITYLEPDPDDEKELQWFEEDLPVSVGKFRLGQSQNTKDRSRFSHLIQCNEGSNTSRLTVFPRKGETWALFKNWDINWSSEPDSHRKFEYEFVEILSDYADGTGVSLAFLHKAKGFASVFFRMGTGDAEISRIPPHGLYRFSHRIPSFKLTGIEGKGLPKDAYELDQVVLPETIKEIIVPFYLLAVRTALKSKPEALCFANKGKVFKTGQIWSYYRLYKRFPRYYGRIEKITLTQAFEQDAVCTLHISRLKATPFPEDVVKWDDNRMPVGCGTFLVMKGIERLTPYEVSHQIVPQTSMDGKEYTILPKIGDLWAIYRSWSPHFEVDGLERWYDYDVVEVLDDTLDYKVLELEPVSVSNEDDEKTFFRAAESSDCEVVFTIRKSKRLKFSHQLHASRVTKVIDGDLKELFEVDTRAITSMIFSSYLRSEGLFPRKKKKT